MKEWRIEIITNENIGNDITLHADQVERLDHFTLRIDGQEWKLPDIAGLSFGEVEEVKE